MRLLSALALAVGVAGEQPQVGLALLAFVEVEQPLLRVHQRRQLRQDQPRHGQQVALALERAGELGQVGLEPVLLGVDPRGVLAGCGSSR